MFLRCTGCLSALKHTLKKSPGWCLVLVSTNGLRDVPVTARTFQRHRVLSTVFLDKQRPLPGHSRHTSCGSGVSGWTQSERVSTVAVELLKSTDRDRYEVLSSTNRRHQRSSDGLFTADRRISMQTRSSSSSQSSSSNKAEVETLKEASAPSSSSPEKASGDEEPEGGKPNKTQQLKKVFKEYGAVGVSFHIGISLMSLGMFYLLISSGIDMAAILCKLGFSEAVVRSRMAAGTSTFVLAYAIHKLFVPVRMSITLVSVPLIVRYLRKTGLFKPPTPAP